MTTIRIILTSMMIIRPIQPSDFPSLLAIAQESGHGFTSLPVDEGLLNAKIQRSEEAFASKTDKPANHSYLFVMENTETGQVVGTSGIEAAVGLHDPFYHYHQGKVCHYSNELGVYNTVDILTLGNDYTGATEICTLFLSEMARTGFNGRLLSRFRFLFIAEHKKRFSDTIMAEMRGVSDEQGRTPFWSWLQEHFFSMEFPDAVHRVGMGHKSFIAELMPKYPIYASLLCPEAQAVIGKVHEKTRPALRLLEKEGFSFRGYVDIFDAGPAVEAKYSDILTVRKRQCYRVSVDSALTSDKQSSPYILCNTKHADFRAAVDNVVVDLLCEILVINANTANALNIVEGDTVCIVPIAYE